MTGAGWRRLAVLLGAALLFVLVSLIARASPYTAPHTASPTVTTTAPVSLAPDAPGARFQDPEAFAEENRGLANLPPLQGLTLFFVGSVALILTGGLVFLGLYLQDSIRLRSSGRAAPGRASRAGADPAELSAAVERARVVLEQGTAREAVVACWLLLQRAGARAGTPVDAAETAAQYAARLAAQQLISEPPLRRLAELYREARFSEHPVGTELRVAARRQLAVLQGELGSGVRL